MANVSFPNTESVFDTPKPTRLIRRMLQLATKPDRSDIVLDFFAGSGSTLHGLYAQNAEDGGNRRCVLVQLPEPIENTNLSQIKTIADITKERVKTSAQKIRAVSPMFLGDLGFRVFKLASSNIRAWDPNTTSIEATLLSNAEHLVQGRSERDVLTELLLKLGLDLCVPIELKEIAGKHVHAVGGGALIVCLADGLSRIVIEPLSAGIIAWWQELAPAVDTRIVFKDSGFADDVAKTNMAAILHQHGLTDLRSL